MEWIGKKRVCHFFPGSPRYETTKSTSRPSKNEVLVSVHEDDLKDSQVTEESESSGFKVPSNLMFNLKSKKEIKTPSIGSDRSSRNVVLESNTGHVPGHGRSFRAMY